MRKTKDRREERNNKTFVSQLKSLKNIPRFIRLIWRISPRLVLLNILLRAVQATLPVCTLYVGKELIDEVVRLNGISKSLESFWNSDVLIFWVWVGFGRLLGLRRGGRLYFLLPSNQPMKPQF